MVYFGLTGLLGTFQTCEHPFRAVCLLATNLGYKSDRNELAEILNLINSWTPIENRIKRGKVRAALNALEAAKMITCEEDRFGKAQQRFYQITKLGQSTLLFLLCSSGFRPTLRLGTLQDSWEKVDTSVSINEALSTTLEKLRPYRELLQAMKNRSMPLPTTAKKYFLSWKPEKALGTKTPERIRFLECLIQEQANSGVGLTSREIDDQFPDMHRASAKIKKLGYLVTTEILPAEGLSIYRLSYIALQCLFPLGLMITEHQQNLDPRSLLLPPTEGAQIYRHLMLNALNFFKDLRPS
ncbi:MAG: hypothetical protein ACXACI_01485 [Candidatus Hodarchaeales archaeon]